MSDEKVCPRCAETVKAAALVCRHCGHEFVQDEAVVTPDATPDATSIAAIGPAFVKSTLKGCGLIVVIILALGVFGLLPDGPDASTDASATPAMAVTAKTLAAAFDANEVAAQTTYGDRPLLVTGTVAGVTLDFSNDAVVQLEGANPFLNVQAALSEDSQAKASGVAKGQTVTMTCGGVSEVIGTPMLSECELP